VGTLVSPIEGLKLFAHRSHTGLHRRFGTLVSPIEGLKLRRFNPHMIEETGRNACKPD